MNLAKVLIAAENDVDKVKTDIIDLMVWLDCRIIDLEIAYKNYPEGDPTRAAIISHSNDLFEIVCKLRGEDA